MRISHPCAAQACCTLTPFLACLAYSIIMGDAFASLIAAALELAQVQEQAGELPAPLENNRTGPPTAAGYMLVNGHELRQRPPNDPDFPNLLYCRRCGHCTGKDRQ